MKVSQLARILNGLDNSFEIEVNQIQINFTDKRVTIRLVPPAVPFGVDELRPYMDHS